jgi:DNA gyrase subunit A
LASGENIIPIEVGQEMKRSFIDYAMSVIVSRAIPDVRDGLKPVHRRIIYDMNLLGFRPDRKHNKSAKTVGDVMANFHPHGDSAIYEALVRLAQPQSSRYPLVDGQGNFGDLDNPPAAMRYTEARLTPLAMEMLRDISLNTVETRPNFDETQDEPVVLPTRVPVLLLNGSAGIAVGMATNIPPHNLREVIDGIIAKIDDPTLDSIGLMQYIKGPDFPGGGRIIGTDAIREAYTTGRGSIVCRGVATIETIAGGGGQQSRNAIIVTALPYLVGPEAFTKRVADLVKDEKIDGIRNLNGETDRTGLRVVIELKRDAHPDVVLNNLYKYSQLQQSFPVNMLGLRLAQSEPRQKLGTASKEKKPDPRKCKPFTLTLHQLIDDFILHRIEVVVAATKFNKEKAEAEKHIKEGLLTALRNLDAVIKIIRGSESPDVAARALMEKFSLDEIQADAILKMTLSKLTRLQSAEIEEDHKKLVAEIAELEAILASRPRVLGIIKDQLLEIKNKFGDDRRTEIESVSTDTDLSAKDLIPNERMLVLITKEDMIKRMPLDTFKRQRRAGRGVAGLKTREGDDLKHFLEANTHDKLMVFTTKGSVYSTDVMDIPESSRSASGRSISNVVNMSQDEAVTAVIPVSDQDLAHRAGSLPDEEENGEGIAVESLPEGGMDGTAEAAPDGSADEELGGVSSEEDYFVMLTTLGAIKKVPISQFSRIRKKGIKAIQCKEEEKEQLGWVRRSNGKGNIIIGSSDGMCIRFQESEVRAMGRNARGVKAMGLREGDRIVGFDVIEPTPDCHMLFVTTDGYGKRVELEEFRVQGRSGLGIIGIKFKNATSRLAALRIVKPKNEVLIATQGGIVVRQRTDEISVQGRMATGVRLQKLDDDEVISVTPVVEQTVEEPDAGDSSPESPARESEE